MDARLQTAVSSGEEYSTISVHKFEDLIVPKFFWLDLAGKSHQQIMESKSRRKLPLQASLYNINGPPVSI